MVEYFSYPALPGRAHFRCERLLANVATERCASMWREANHGHNETSPSCKRCPIGAMHAGEVNASTSSLCGMLICGRCQTPALRLIHKHLCVSCYNRSREVINGRNAKGTRPVKLPPMAPRRIWFMAGGALRSLSMPLTVDTDELVIAALRDTADQVRFTFRASAPRIRQAALW